ncbi:hypothetical protein N9X48_01105 [Luminiphilus sp.]|nr:hypothetical protein [Luminiphilus sp.]
MKRHETLLQDTELMADFRACMKWRQETANDVYEFFLARTYEIEVVENMQRRGYLSLWIWLPIFLWFPYFETIPWFLLHISLAVQWDFWWGRVFAAHQRFVYRSRMELRKAYGDDWEDGPVDWTKFTKVTDDK